jgi:hypothetical protein
VSSVYTVNEELVSCLTYSILKIEAVCSSETSVDFQQAIRRCIPEDSTHHNHHCENLKSYLFLGCQLDDVKGIEYGNWAGRNIHKIIVGKPVDHMGNMDLGGE